MERENEELKKEIYKLKNEDFVIVEKVKEVYGKKGS